MAPASSQSMRTERRNSGYGVPSNTTPHSRTIPVHLERQNSEDSSVFAGLNTPRGIPQEVSSIGVPHSVRFQDKGKTPRGTPTQVGRYKLKSFNEDYQDSEADDDGTDYLSVVRSKSENSSEHSYMRNMKPMADEDSAFGAESKDFEGERPHGSKHNRRGSNTRRQSGQSSYLMDQGGGSGSYGSVNAYAKSKGTYNMVGQVNFSNKAENEYKPEKGETITAMLDDYEKQMEATLESLTLDDDNRDDIVGDRDYLAEMYDIVPKRVQSEDAHQTLTSEQSKQLQKVLHQARTEVEILKDNNEQFMSEIEQQEEEYRSERKLFEERTRQKISELKVIYQEEIENIIREKDAAIVEASRQATRYGESGRRQIAHLKAQLEKVKAQANGIIRQKIEEAIKTMSAKKEMEVSARLGALRNSYETEFEKIRNERGADVQQAVNQAIAETEQRLATEHEKKLIESLEACRKQAEMENQNAIFASNQSLAHSERQVNKLQKEREGFIKTLEAIKENINQHYPAQMKVFHDRSRDVVGPLKLLQTQQGDSKLENLFKDVVESFGFLLENSSKKSVSYNVVKMDDLQKRLKEQETTREQYREHVDYATPPKEDESKNSEALEGRVHNPVIDRNQSEELYRRDINSQYGGIKNMHSADDLIQGMTKRRERLAHAMAVGQMELKNSLSSDRMQYLKPNDRFVPKGLDANEGNIEQDGEVPEYRRQSCSNLPTGRRSSVESPDAMRAKQSDDYESFISNNSRARDSEPSYESPAKKKSYAILRSFKASKRRGSVGPKADSPMHSTAQGKGQTRTQRLKGYLNTAFEDDFDAGQNDNSTNIDSLTDESLESLQTNTGTEVNQTVNENNGESNLGIDHARSSSSSLERSKSRNPLGMFARAKKDAHDARDAPGIDSTNTRAPTEDTLQPLPNGQELPTNFRKIPGQGFDHRSAGNVINGKKPAVKYDARGVLQNDAYPTRRGQENAVPESVSLQNNTSKSSDYSGSNGYNNDDEVSYLSDNRSIRSVNETTTSLDDEDVSRLRQHTSLTDASDDDESADPFLMTETESSDRTSTQGKIYSASSSRDSSRLERSPYSKQQRGVRSPNTGSEATTAVISHRVRPNFTSFYSKEAPATKTSKVATNFASRIRARRGGRRLGG
ncbi:unnamed protein product [Cylindrotheca closterium]|uniref:Uncharacterized protein n=1 Tax=Cylindrotheca closterium TaxID=2856 RepID=A0AAD2JH92_9STRA|nr:unnamed protein product [Cylindrotheca closterium]